MSESLVVGTSNAWWHGSVGRTNCTKDPTMQVISFRYLFIYNQHITILAHSMNLSITLHWYLEMKMYLIWNKYQSFTPVAERFLKQVRLSFSENS